MYGRVNPVLSEHDEYQADTYFSNLDLDEDWEMDLESEEETYFNLCYTFRRYVRKKDHKTT